MDSSCTGFDILTVTAYITNNLQGITDNFCSGSSDTCRCALLIFPQLKYAIPPMAT